MQVTENNFHDISDWKMISLTMLTMLFYFTTINQRDWTTVITLPLSIKHFSSQELQCFPKICLRESHFTARKLSLTCFTTLFSDFWPNFPFNTSETILDYYLETWYTRVTLRVAVRLKVYDLRKLENIRKVVKLHRIIA